MGLYTPTILGGNSYLSSFYDRGAIKDPAHTGTSKGLPQAIDRGPIRKFLPKYANVYVTIQSHCLSAGARTHYVTANGANLLACFCSSHIDSEVDQEKHRPFSTGKHVGVQQVVLHVAPCRFLRPPQKTIIGRTVSSPFVPRGNQVGNQFNSIWGETRKTLCLRYPPTRSPSEKIKGRIKGTKKIQVVL